MISKSSFFENKTTKTLGRDKKKRSGARTKTSFSCGLIDSSNRISGILSDVGHFDPFFGGGLLNITFFKGHPAQLLH